ncbi:acetyl-CoA sensor PanZ family protein [Dongshaea marina]|uniref:acetyl-CoA sensor PanZ family protein n=1 Tax=Dongshaea marina TaxID=2047966 RepID=UPI000D3E701E|nr:acetyl-CoA sensor PanZ family protein [Dongshaea marina]
MRLTIHHLNEIPTEQQTYVEKMFASPEQASHWLSLGLTIHLAIFNEKGVAIALSDRESIRFLTVRDVTRRRGVGRYLLEQLQVWMRDQGYPKITMDLASLEPQPASELRALLVNQQFEADGSCYQLTL